MSVADGLKRRIAEASLQSPDPQRAERNLLRFFETVRDEERFLSYTSEMARLFSMSQFLSNHATAYPEDLHVGLRDVRRPITKESLLKDAGVIDHNGVDEINEIMRRIRLFKKGCLLRATLRDILSETDMVGSMDELTTLAEVVISIALGSALRINMKRYGEPSPAGSIALIGLGKIGGVELNYSSDVDLMAVYDDRDGQTTGVSGPTGVRLNRISNHEFYCKVVETFTKLLSSNTEEGIAYRVDLRLRPQGQKGELALPLKAYRTYYESWGRTWERMVLIRARPVAGDGRLGDEFMQAIQPFVWKKTIDYSEIEEIGALKKMIDSTLLRDDIKRGYGGIREAEFFVQAFQLIYGSEKRSLRTHRLLNAIQALRWLRIISGDDLAALWDNYIYLRRIEHYLQMRDDLRTHSLPRSEEELECLGRKMGFISAGEFLSDLRIRRMQIKNMYNSLLGTREDVYAEAMSLIEGEHSDDELRGYLSFRGVRSPERALSSLKGIRERLGLFKTQRERSVIRRVIPELLDKALNSKSPDRALSGVESFLSTGIKGAHFTGLMEKMELIDGIVRVFSLSSYLTRVFLSCQRYLDLLIEEMIIRKTMRRTAGELQRRIQYGRNFQDVVSEYKIVEELRLGIYFLMGVIKEENLFRYLSHLAEVILRKAIEHTGVMEEFSVLAMGKLGGREISYGSDIDMVFVSETPGGIKAAEQIIRLLSTYSDRGLLYSVDMRLRPDGTKGALIKDIEGYRNYYLRSAQPWEIQTLLKARPAGGDTAINREFYSLAREAIIKRGRDLSRQDLLTMRERIKRELSNEDDGIDIKLGPGGIEDIEFYIQWLQLQNAHDAPDVIVQNTLAAVHRLFRRGIIGEDRMSVIVRAYEYYRRLDTFLRLNEDHVVRKDGEITGLLARFMGHSDSEELLESLGRMRTDVSGVISSS